MLKRVVYLGNFAVPWTTECEIASCFRALGWECKPIQEDVLVNGYDQEWREIGEACADADLVVYTRTVPLLEHRALDLWDMCAMLGVPTASIHLDLFHGLGSPKGQFPRHQLPYKDPMFKTAYVFTPDGDHDNEWEEAGVNHYWLPPAIGCDSCFDGNPDPRWDGIDVAFVGSRGYHPEWPHRPRLIDELHRRFGDRFAHVSGETISQALRGQELHDLYASVPVIVGDSAWIDVKPPETRYWSDRVYEVWGRGGFLVMPFIHALDEHIGYKPCFPSWERWDDFDDIEHVIRYWLERPDERERARVGIVQRIRSEHTWAQRLTEALEIMSID